MVKDIHKFYTGFTWDEIKEIKAAIKRTIFRPYADIKASDDDEFFDYPSYGKLPKRISDRLSTDQVDLINQEEPRTLNDLARVLAQGRCEAIQRKKG